MGIHARVYTRVQALAFGYVGKAPSNRQFPPNREFCGMSEGVSGARGRGSNELVSISFSERVGGVAAHIKPLAGLWEENAF